MQKTTFLERTLGIDRPWYVENAELDRATGVFLVQLNFEEGGTFACGACGERGCKAYDAVLEALAAHGLLRVPDVPARTLPAGDVPQMRDQAGAAALGAAQERVHAGPGGLRGGDGGWTCR